MTSLQICPKHKRQLDAQGYCRDCGSKPKTKPSQITLKQFKLLTKKSIEDSRLEQAFTEFSMYSVDEIEKHIIETVQNIEDYQVYVGACTDALFAKEEQTKQGKCLP